MAISEMAKLKGFRPHELNFECMSSHRLGEALGNAMTQTVLVAIFKQLFVAMGWR